MNEDDIENKRISRPGVSKVTLLPENYEELQSTQWKKLGNLLIGIVSLLLIGGFVSYCLWFYEDWLYRREGITTTAVINSVDVQTKATRGKGQVRTTLWTTNTINYQYSTQDGEQASGRDKVKTWRHIPKSNSGVAPKNNEEILVEYLKSDPKTSRILIPNRYQSEYTWSATAIAVAIFLILIQFVNLLRNPVRAQVYGVLFLLAGIVLFTWATNFVFFQRHESDSADDSMIMTVFFLAFCVPISLTLLWIGWFFFSSARLSPSDPRQLLELLKQVEKKDSITILAYGHFGTQAAILLEEDSRRVHFVNCHVKKGFLPWVMPLHSCLESDLKYTEKHHKTKYGKTMTQAILATPTGTTSIYHDVPGVLAFLQKLPPRP
jgi:hypothetical protein